ncbi:MAG: hypothetical protein WCP29_11430 [Acidobacteriota bacterium]
METSRRQRVVLAVLAASLAGTAWWQWGSGLTPGDPPATSAAAPGSSTAAPRPAVTRAVPVVALARLTHVASEPSDTGRDPFRFGARAGLAGRAGVGTTPTMPAVAPPPVRAAEPVVPTGPPPPPPIPLRFIAVMSKRAGLRIAMLTDGRGVYSGSVGAVIEGQYRILRIGADSIDMVYVDGRGRRTIPLSGS